MATLTQVRNGIQTQLSANITKLQGRVYDHVPDTLDPPSVIVVPGTFIPGDTKAAISYDSTFGRNVHDYVFTLVVVVSRTVDRVGQAEVDKYISASGTQSLKQALELDMTLGGVAHFVNVDRVIQYGVITWNGLSFFGAQVVVEVTA